MKNSVDLGGCYPPLPSASVDNTLLDLQNSSYPTQPLSIIANYTCIGKGINLFYFFQGVRQECWQWIFCYNLYRKWMIADISPVQPNSSSVPSNNKETK